MGHTISHRMTTVQVCARGTSFIVVPICTSGSQVNYCPHEMSVQDLLGFHYPHAAIEPLLENQGPQTSELAVCVVRDVLFLVGIAAKAGKW